MIDYIKNRKEELRKKSESYKEILEDEYERISGKSNGITKAGLIGGGLALGVMVAFRLLNHSKRKSRKSADTEETTLKAMPRESEENSVKSEFKGKLTIIILEIFRQLLLMVAKNLKPVNGKSDIQ